jgi:hypothetical protein
MTRYTRQEAKALGLPTCFGSPCQKHPELEGLRRVSGACAECAKEHLRSSRRSDPDRTRAQEKKDRLKAMADPAKAQKKRDQDVEYRAKNREKCAEIIKAWSAKNPEKVREYARKTKLKNAETIRMKGVRYRLENPEKRKQTTRNWRQNNKHLVAAAQQRRHAAELKRTPGWLSDDEHWVMQQAYEIAAVRTKLFGFSWHVDHIIPLQGRRVSGLHVPLNLQVIPGVENMRKLNKFEVTT